MTGPQMEIGRQTGADFSNDRVHRYALWREWDAARGTVNFLMLNPSTADEYANDPTVERCERYARRWLFGRLVVTNIFAFRSTDPYQLFNHPDPVGPRNDAAILEHAAAADLVVVAWGNHGWFRGRDFAAIALLERARPGRVPLCLGVNRTGQPVHPLYQPSDAKLIPFPKVAIDG